MYFRIRIKRSVYKQTRSCGVIPYSCYELRMAPDHLERKDQIIVLAESSAVDAAPKWMQVALETLKHVDQTRFDRTMPENAARAIVCCIYARRYSRNPQISDPEIEQILADVIASRLLQ